MKFKMGDKAVSEVVGAILLLAIAVSAFSVIYINVLSDDGPDPNAFVKVIAKCEYDGDVVFDHSLGVELPLDSPVILTIAGQRITPYPTVGDLLSYNSKYTQDNRWNIGEQLIYRSNQPLRGVEIKADIFDKKTGKMVFWGTLQEGYTVPPFGRGGIWHFNESCWHNGTALEVKDSSGNNNHGTAYNGANTTDDVVSASANRSGVFNVVDYDDYVQVADAYSLDITDHITMEAWIKPFSDSFGTMGLMDQFGYTPYITNVSGSRTIYAIVSEDVGHEANLQTINVTPHKQLSENSLVDIEYNFGEGNKTINQNLIRPIIAHVSDNVYLIAYNSKNIDGALNVNLKTFNISSNGSIEYTGNNIFDTGNSDIGVPNRPSIVKVSDFGSYSILAIAYSIKFDDSHPCVGIIKTVNISNDGKIKYTGFKANFDDIKGIGPSIIHVSGKVFAVSYRNASNLGVVKTFNISSNGSIIYTGKQFVFDDKNNEETYNPSSIVKVSDSESYSVIAIAYGAYINNQHPGVGIIKTMNVYDLNGSVISTGYNKTFESVSCFDPCMIHHSENYYIIAYSTGNPLHGNYSVIEIAKNGSIILKSNNVLVLDFQNNQNCEYPIAIKISERFFAIVFQGLAGGNGHPGYLMPIQMEYPSDLYSKGIYKLGSYGMYANPSKVFVSINNKTISESINANTWNYIVLTYDRQNLILYINGFQENSTPMTEAIKITSSNLIFGDLFYGLIDEVAVYDKVLSATDVYYHFKQFAPIRIFNVNISYITYNSAKITWETNIPSNSTVRYGTNTSSLNLKISDSSMVSLHSITLTGLNSKTTYYFEVESTGSGYTILDNNGGRYYTFTTENTAPNIPRLPNPDNGSKNVKTTVILGWVGGDEDGDNVTYDVYFGTTNPPTIIVSANQSIEYYDPDPDLVSGTTYYWQIIAKDTSGAITAGPIWYFSTKK